MLFINILSVAANNQTIAQILNSTNTRTSLIWKYIAQISDAASALESPGTYTVFAPTDSAVRAFNKTNSTLFNHTFGDRNVVREVLEYHVVPQPWTKPKNGTKVIVTTLAGLPLVITTQSKSGKPTDVTGGLAHSAQVGKSYNCSNGVLYIIDSILIPPLSLSETTTFLNLSGTANLLNFTGLTSAADNLSNKTILVPRDQAITQFTNIAQDIHLNLSVSVISTIIDNHIVSGVVDSTEAEKLVGKNVSTYLPHEHLTVGRTGKTITLKSETDLAIPAARVVVADILVTEGIVHVIDAVLVPSNATLQTAIARKGPLVPT